MKSGLAKNGQEAFDLLTRASQKVPAALREDLLDAGEEYSTFFNSLGIKGPEAFAMLANGSKLGQYGIDKVGDAIKEFTIRSTDGSNSTVRAFKAIGLDADKMSNQILAGGDTSKAALQKIVGGLLKIKDPSKRAQMSLALFGTPLEDLNVNQIPTFLKALKDGGKGMDKWRGSTERAGKTLNDNAATNLESFKRQLTTGFVQILGGQVVPKINAFAKRLAGMGVTVNDVAKALMIAGAAFAVWKTGAAAISIWTKATALAKSIALGTRIQLAALRAQTIAMAVASKVSAAATVAWSVASKGAAIASRVLGVALRFAMGPWGLLIAAVAAGAFLIIKNWDKIKAATAKVWGWIKTAVSNAFEFMKKIFFNFTGPGLLIKHWDKIKSGTKKALEAVKNSISKFAGYVKDQFLGLARKVGDWGKKIGDRLWEGIKKVGKTLAGIGGWVWGKWRQGNQALYGRIFSMATTAGKKVWSGITGIADKLRGFGTWAWDKFKGRLGSLKDRFKSLGSSLTSGLVSGMRNVWDKIKDLTKKPLNGIITLAINPFIGAVNKVIPGKGPLTKAETFRTGGAVRGPGSSTSDSIPARLSNGEHVWTADEVRRAGGHGVLYRMRELIARGRLARGARSGDLGAATDRFGLGFAGGGAIDSKRVEAAKRFAQAQAGKPYIWGGVGPVGYDCSGFMSAIANVLLGRSPYSRMGTSASFPWPGFKSGPGQFTVGAFTGNPGHVAGTLDGMNVESTNGSVRVGSAARGATNSMFTRRAHLGADGAGFLSNLWGKFKDSLAWFKNQVSTLLPKVGGGGLFSTSTMRALAKQLMTEIKKTVPGFAKGGVVTKPTLAMVGEDGPEAMVPLTGGRRRGPASSPIVVQVKVEGSVIVERDLIDSITRGIDQARRAQGQRTSILKVS